MAGGKNKLVVDGISKGLNQHGKQTIKSALNPARPYDIPVCAYDIDIYNVCKVYDTHII